jgi:hypothetical protein
MNKKEFIFSIMPAHWIIIGILMAPGCKTGTKDIPSDDWTVSVLPASLRLDPVTSNIIDDRYLLSESNASRGELILKKNWIYDGERVSLHAARGEYISFQLVLTRNTGRILKGISIDMPSFKNKDSRFPVEPELFLEWSVQVKHPAPVIPRQRWA